MSSRGRWLPPLMLLLLAGYIAVHSPLLGALARLTRFSTSRCYFACGGWIAGLDPAAAPAAALALVLAVLAGWVVSGQLDVPHFDQLLGFGLVTLALATVPAATLGALGWVSGGAPLRPPAGPLLSAVPSAAVLILGLASGRRPRVPTGSTWSPLGLELLLLALAVVLLTTSALAAVTHPPTGYDALSYHGPLAVYLWRDGNLGAFLHRQPGAWALAHPGTAELWAGLLRLAGGEAAANLGQLPLALLGALAVYVFALRTGAGRPSARIGALAFLLAPIVVLQSGVQLNDLAAGVLLMSVIALAAAPPEEWGRGRLALMGLGLGLALTTKLATLPAVAGIGVAVLAGAGRARLPLVLGMLGLGAAVVVAPWWGRNIAMFGNPFFPAAIPLIGRGVSVQDFIKKDTWFVPRAWLWPAYPLVEPHNEMSGLGALFAVGALPGLLVALRRARRWPMVLYGITFGFALPGWWWLTQHEPRLLLGPLGLASSFVGWSLRGVTRRLRPVAVGGLAAAGVFSALVTFDQALSPLIQAPSGRGEFYEVTWGIDSVAASLPEREGLLYHTGHATRSYAGDYPLLGLHQERILVVIDDVLPADSIVRIMRRQGLRFAYVPAREESRRAIERMYPAGNFELIHQSAMPGGGSREGTRRYLYRLREE